LSVDEKTDGEDYLLQQRRLRRLPVGGDLLFDRPETEPAQACAERQTCVAPIRQRPNALLLSIRVGALRVEQLQDIPNAALVAMLRRLKGLSRAIEQRL
jgi:hypothetical protein